MKCSYCNNEAIEEVYGKAYCKIHFNNYFIGRVRSIIDKFKIKGKIAVALSGGKDSSACFHALHSLKLELKPFYINLGIKNYSDICQEKSDELCEQLGYELDVIYLDDYGIELEKYKKPCSACGTAKRYLMNKFAYENSCKYIATGHNLSDVVTFAMNNLISGNILNFRGNKPYLDSKEKYKLIAKIRPLFWLKDKECMLYTWINRLAYAEEECPYSISAPTIRIKEWLNELETNHEGALLNIAKSLWKLEEKMEKDFELNLCSKCGYVSYGKICKFCKIRKK